MKTRSRLYLTAKILFKTYFVQSASVVLTNGRDHVPVLDLNKIYSRRCCFSGVAKDGGTRAAFRRVPLFRSRNSRIPKKKEKGFRHKITEFSVQMRLETKQNEKTRSLPQTNGVMISHHNMVSPEAGRPLRPPIYATALFE